METCLATERIFEGRVFSVRRDAVRLADGSESTREVVEHNGGVAIVALDDRDRITLVRQFRYAAGMFLWEIPAGKLEKGEDPAACALRELREETGLRCRDLISLGCILPTCAYDTEKIYLYLARGLTQGESCPDEGEFLEICTLPLGRALEGIASGEIVDAKTIAGIFKAAQHIEFQGSAFR